MKCPICEIDLVMADRQGVEIDYCSKCRGVWLDRGELDKIIEKSFSGDRSESFNTREQAPMFRGDSGHYGHENHGSHDSNYGGRKKKGLLGEIFDF